MSIKGTGPAGRIILADVEDALKAGPAIAVNTVEAPAEVKKAASPSKKAELPNNMYDDLDVSQIRKVIAERLSYSK